MNTRSVAVAALMVSLTGLGRAQNSGRGASANGTAAASVLDRLPRVAGGGYTAALAAARQRGPNGAADVLWLELFYGPPAAKAEAETALTRVTTPPASAAAEMAFVQFVSAYSQGQDRQMLAAALRLTESAPNDVATELAVRTLSGELENQGRALLDAVPAIERTLDEPLADPTTAYMLGRSLLAAVHAPGVALTPERAQALAGRLAHWQLWGPFGNWQNLDFDATFPIERGPAASYADGSLTRQPQAYDSASGAVQFPLDWGQQGLDFAVTYVHATQPTLVMLRLYSAASAQVEINGVTVIDNDRRARYTPATAVAAVELAAGWSRVVVKLGGEERRDFDLMLRAESTTGGPAAATAWSNADGLPPDAKLAGQAKILPAPETLAGWSTARLQRHPDDAVALWVDGIRRVQDEDGEGARVALTRAGALAPQAAPVWLTLAETYGALEDASQSWAAAQMETAAHKALKADPRALRAYDRLGHVYQSEGKNTQAAEQYAHCTGKGYADCDWSAFHLAASQRWTPEAETALSHALVESSSDWNSIASALDFYASVGDAAKVADWERVLRADPRAAGTLGAYELNQGHAAAAAKLLATACGFEPSSAALRREYLDALLLEADAAAGTAQSQAANQKARSEAAKALADFPYDRRIAAGADDIGLQQNLSQGIADLRRTDFNRNSFRHEANFLTGDKFWQPWYHSAAEILRDAPGKGEYPNASSILVFDQMVNRINPDSSQDQYIHQIFRVLNAAGISALGDQSIAPGSDLITVRTIKQSGAMLLPENVSNLSNITMPGLEAGDYIEVEYVQHMPPSTIIPGTINNEEFFEFNSAKQQQPDNYADYIVLTPPQYPLLVDQERFSTPPTVTTLADGYTAQEWLLQKMRELVSEPHMPPEENLVPKVWISSSTMGWGDLSQYLADHLYSVQRATPEMQAEAAKLAAGQAGPIDRANAIFNWVVANIQPAQGAMLQPARQYFTDGSGNRTSVFLALLAAARVPFQLVLTRGVTDESSIKIPSLYQFTYPLIHVAGGTGPAGWYDLNGDFARQGYIVPDVRGALALVTGATGPAEFTHVPQFVSPLDGVVITATGTVADSGNATLKLRLEFRGPNGQQIREALADQPASSLPQIYQQMALANYPNATATGGAVANLTDKSQPLVITVDATVPGFVHNDGGTAWDIEHLASPAGLLQRYAPLPFRTQPLVIAGGSFEQTNVAVTLPARFAGVELPPDAHIDNAFGSFSAGYTDQGGKIVFNRSLELKPNLIPPNQYDAFRNFGESVDNQDRLRITGTVAAAAAAPAVSREQRAFGSPLIAGSLP